MSTAYTVVTALAVVANTAAAWVDFARSRWVLDNMAKYGLPPSWIIPLGVVKAAGALGLVAGFFVPALGVVAAACLVAYFVGAVATVVRARCWSDVPYPAGFLLVCGGALALGVAVA